MFGLILTKLGIGWVGKEKIEKILILKESLIFKTKSNGTLFLDGRIVLLNEQDNLGKLNRDAFLEEIESLVSTSINHHPSQEVRRENAQ
ncbi:MAG TPA: hypothetical protein PLO13_03125 [Anaerolineaceae bacterium]|nr:hypothetical protein [Anaerolineaceae bacterium]HQJ32325.1 hypothetical protein [Anaerolineaceae bacterium]